MEFGVVLEVGLRVDVGLGVFFGAEYWLFDVWRGNYGSASRSRNGDCETGHYGDRPTVAFWVFGKLPWVARGSSGRCVRALLPLRRRRCSRLR